MKEKIIFITDYFGPNPGGIENFHTGLIKHWYEDNIITICFDHNFYVSNEDLEYFNQNINKQLYRFDVSNKNYFNQRKILKDFFTLMNHIQEYNHIKHILLGNVSLTVKMLFHYIMNLQVPYSIILHPFDLEAISFYHFKTIKFLKNAEYIFIYTNYFYDLALVKGISQDKLVKIPFGLYVRWNDNNQKIRKEFKGFLNQFKYKTKILTVGPLTKKKKFERILYTLEKLKTYIDLEDICWFIAGSGNEYHYIKELIQQYNMESYIYLTGFLNDREIGYLYFFSDIYFHPGGIPKDQFSGYSTSVLEAGYTSLPTVAAMGAAIDDIIQNNVTGFILRYDDYEGMAFKLKELIQEPKLRKTLGRFAEQKILKEFSIERSVYNIYQRIL
ncbi:MAG: glycosyl transferase [Leptospiraceae bacterium]|nr:MAG: glycosyl transferase [Leptospiraceae bacterium]